jgi:hypothetical protein
MDRFEEWGKASGFSVYDVVQNGDDIADGVATFLDETVGPAGTGRARPVRPKDARLRMDTVRAAGVRFRSDNEIRGWLSRGRTTGSSGVPTSAIDSVQCGDYHGQPYRT